MDERFRFIGEYLTQRSTGRVNMTALCKVYGVSRTCGYKWLNRYVAQGFGGLQERSRAPRKHPNAVSDAVVQLVVQTRRQHSTWGPKKLKAWMETHYPGLKVPAASTLGRILKDRGLVKPRKRRRRSSPIGPRIANPKGPNDIWTADFKGQFRTRNGALCYPLTVQDCFSRYFLACEALPFSRTVAARPVFERAFAEHGVPWAIRTDNGPPFASTGLAGLTQLSVWWLKLGIQLQRIEPGRPDQNGRHERLHRTLKQETASPPEKDLHSQQDAFGRFRQHYNHERPHEALDNRTPSALYRPSGREYPARIPEVEYPAHYELHRIRNRGGLRFRGHEYYVAEVLRSEPVGLLEVSDGLWAVHFSALRLGELDERNRQFRAAQRPRRARRR